MPPVADVLPELAVGVSTRLGADHHRSSLAYRLRNSSEQVVDPVVALDLVGDRDDDGQMTIGLGVNRIDSDFDSMGAHHRDHSLDSLHRGAKGVHPWRHSDPKLRYADHSVHVFLSCPDAVGTVVGEPPLSRSLLAD